MNKIFKTKYDVTTGQTKAVSELANNRQVASRVEAAGSQPKCGVFFGGILGLFKVLPLALVINGMFSSISYSADVWIEFKDNDLRKNGDLHEGSGIWYNKGDHHLSNPNQKETTLLTSGQNKAGAETTLRNKDFWRTVAIGSRAVAGGTDSTSIGYRAIVGKNNSSINVSDSHQGTAVGYRTFAYGNEAVSLGNDTVAYGESSISIGSDNVGKGIGKYSQKGLSYDIWKLYRQNGSKFNYTGEYAAIDGSNSDTSPAKYREYLNQRDVNKPFYKTHNWAYGDSSIAIGSRNVAYGHGSTAIGTLSVAKGDYSTALGTATLAFGESSVALGNESYVYASNSIGVGNNVQAISVGSMVYGYQSYAGGLGSIAIGKRALANVEPSAHFKQTVEEFGNSWYEGESTADTLHKLDIPSLGGKHKTLDEYFTPATVKQDGTEEEKAKSRNGGAVALGYYVYALGENSIALGRQAYSKGNRSIAIGPYAYGGYEKTIAIGYGAKALANQSFAIGSLSRAEGQDSIAFGVNSKVLKDQSINDLSGQNSIALGNDSEVTMKNSVAIGNMSNTRYYYTGNESNPSPSNNNNNNNRNNAISLPPYIPRGTSYSYTSTSEDGVVSVGGWDKMNGNIGRRRIINVAPGALDSDVATVGQLKALEYTYKEGVVAYYTVENGKNYKVVKHTDGQFYKANTENGTPLDGKKISADKVFVGPKGANETPQIIEVDGQQKVVVDMGDKIKFAHIKDGDIENNSNQAITGNQLNQLGKTILGLNVQSADKTKFDTPSFAVIDYEGSQKQQKTKFKDAVDELITAVNKGLVIAGDNENGKITLGSTLNIKAGNTTVTDQNTKTKTEYKSDNIRTAYQPNKKTLLIGIKENPTFKSVSVSEPVTDNSPEGTLTTKKYVDDKLKDAGKSHYLSVKEPVAQAGNYNNDGAKGANSVAIGVDVQTKSDAHSAVAIGHNLSTDIKHAVVVGSNINIEQNNSGDKNKKDAVVAIGSGLKLKNAKSSIVLAAVDERGNTDDTEEGRTVVDGASWAVVIGNKTKVKNGSDIVALGNNIDVSGRNNNSLVILGNQAQASNAENSVVLGKEAHVQTQNVVALGYKAKAETAATGGVALGRQATVKKSNGIALGSYSEANTGGDQIGFNTVTGVNHTNANTYGAWKSKYGALSIGKPTETRQITGVAAGSQDTDAVNVAQLKEATTHFVSIKNTNKTSQNYANNGATADNAIAIGVETKAQSNAGIAIGYGTQVLGNSNNSIAIGAVSGGSPTKIENAAWAVAIGNKTTVTGGNDVVALGSNISVTKTDSTDNINHSVVVIGNNSQAENAKSSVVIGHEAKAMSAQNAVVIGKGAESKATSAVVLGKGATVQANATSAVAIGEEASVSTNAGESIALGKGSQATAKANAEANATVEGVKFAFAGGTGNNKTVLSIGKAGTERVIKHVAAGEVSKTSTDAINGSQLFSVTTEFAKLAKDVLGAELGTTDQFKKSEFKTLKASSSTADTTIAKTFKAAIDANIEKINEGFTFSDGITEGTRYLGEKITIQSGVVDGGDFVSDNIKTNYGKDQGVFRIGIKKDPRFEKVTVTKDVEDASPEMTLTTKKYVDGKLANVAAKFIVKGDTNGTNGKGYELNKDNTELNINGDAKNITTEVDKTAKKITVSLKSALTGITSIGKDESNKITFNGGTTITAGGAGLTLANEGDKVKISNVADGTTANDAVNKSQLDTKQDKLTGTITANNGLQITSGDGKNTVASNITLGLETGLKDKIDNALSKTEAGNTYAKVDASNINNGNQTAWRNKLEVYSKSETADEIAKAKETVTNGEGIIVSATPDGTDGPKTFTVALAEDYKNKINSIGTGSVADNDKNTVTGDKVHTAIEEAKTALTSKINDKADKTLSNIDETGKAKIKTLATEAIDVQGKEGELKVTSSTSDNKKSFTVSLNDDIKTKIDGIGTGTVVADNDKTVTGGAVHTAIEAAKTALKGDLYDKNATFGLTGDDNQEVKKTLNNTIKISGGQTAKTNNSKNIYVSTNNDGSGLTIELGENLEGIKKISQGKKAAISLEDKALTLTSNNNKVAVKSDHVLSDNDIYIGTKTDENKLVKKSELGGGYITFEDENASKGTKNVNFGKKVIYGKSAEITATVTNSGDDAKVTFAINDASIEGTKLKDNTIAEAKLDQGIQTKLNKTFKVTDGDKSSDNLIGEELEFATKDANLTVGLDDTKKKITYGLSSALTGIESISKDDNTKITFKNNGLNEIDFKVGTNTTYKFTDSGLDLASKAITNLGSGLDTSSGSTRQNLDELLKLVDTQQSGGSSNNQEKLNKAINAGDLLHVAQGLVDKGLKFKVDNGTSTSGSTTETTKKLGDTLTFKGDGKYLTTKLNDTNGEISFNLSVAESISDASTQNTINNKLVTENAVKNFVTNKLNNLSSTLQLEGDNTKNDKDPADPIGKVELKTQKLKLTGETNEIVTEVTKDNPSVKIKLAQKVKNKLEIINVGENTNGDNSFALGQNSTLEAKKLAPSGATPNVGSNDVTITWNTAGASKDKNDLREVVSIGSADKERIITHVAAGNVADGSTDAINGGQLKSVIDVFANLGISVLGAEKAEADKDGFKQSKFTAVQYKRDRQEQAKEKDTFKGAIDETIIAINKGLKFDGNSGGPKDLKLGDTLTIKGADTVASSAGANSAPHRNITTTAKDDGILEIALNQDLKGISSISGKNGSGSAVTKIEFTNGGSGSGASTSPTVKITADGGEFTFGKDGLNLNSKQITGIASGLGLIEASNTGGGNSDTATTTTNKGIIDKVLDGTIVTQNGTKNNAVNVKDLSEVAKALVEKGLSFEGNDGSSNKVTRKLGDTLKIEGKGSGANSITTTENNIKVSKNTANDGLEIGLSETLTGIKSVGNGDNVKITLSGSNRSEDKITFKAGSSEVTLADGEFSGVSEINKAEGKGALKLADSTATLESAKDNSKVELKDKAVTITAQEDKGTLKLTKNTASLESANEKSKLELADGTAKLESVKDGSNLALDNTGATLSAGKDAGSIKVVNNGDKKIELSPENGSTVTLKKDTTNGGVQATGLSTIGKDDSNALVFKNGTGNTAELKVGGNALTFTPTNGAGKAKTVKISNVADGQLDDSSSEAITGKQLHALGATHLGLEVDTDNTKFKAPTFTAAIKGSGKTDTPTTFKGAIDQLITAVNGGLTFKGNDSTPTQTTLQLGGTLSIDSSTVGNGTTGATGTTVEKDITVTLAPSNGNDPQSAGTLTLTLNKAMAVSDKNEKVITSKAVAEELTKYTTTETLDKDFLKVTGENIGDDTEEKKKQGRKTFGSNVGIAEIKLAGPDKSSTELVQADAVIKYLKGTGEKSVKVSDNPETKAEGEGSIAIGDKAIAQNEGAISIGQNSGAKNNGAISIGKDSDVTKKDGIAIGTGTKVSGQSSVALGESNKVSGVQSYVIGSDNDIKGKDVIAIGSKIIADDKISDAVILGNRSTGEANTVSVGSKDTKRRIIFVDTPKNEYDAVNKKYVDDLTLTYKSNGEDKTKQTVKLTDGLNFKKGENDNIQVVVDKNGSIQHNLNQNLKYITSIWGGTDESGAKIILAKDKKEISLNESKLKGLLDGDIDKDSKEAVTGKQLADLSKQLGIDVDDKTKTTFKAPTFDELKLKEVDGKDGAAPQNIVGGLKNVVTKLNEGLKFGGDVQTGTNNGTHYLGSTINIVSLGTPTGTSATTVQPSIADYSGSNLITQYTYDKGNAKIEIGFKDAPSFNKVTLSAPQTYGNGKGVEDNDLITKSYLEQALNSFKFNVEYGAQKVQIGRDDTLKFENGLNIQGKLKQEGATPAAPAPTPTDTATVSTTPTAPASDATGGTADTVSNATAVVTIGTTEALKNITSISSKPKDESADGSGAGSSAGGNGAGSTGKVTKLTLDPTDGATFQVGNTGAKVNINDEGIALMPQGANGANSSPVEIPSITINAGSKPVDSNSIDLLDPANGPSIAFTAKSGSNGSAKEGTGTIKYLKDRTVSKKNSNGDKYGEGDNKGNAATEGAVKELYESGLKFAGNDGEVHKKLGETLSIKGEGTVGETAADNIVVRTKDNGLEIGLTKNIRNIDTISIAGTGDDSGKDIFIDAEGMTTTAKLDDGTVLVNNQTASGNVLRSGTHQTEVKAGEVAIKDKSGQEIVSLKVAENTNGQGNNGGNAQSATLAFATTGTDGQSGTGSITGLADLADDADGSSAANKNYVDEKVSDLDSNRPFDFYVKEGEKEIKVVKGRDGKFYKPEDLKGAKYVAGTADGDKGKYTKNGQDVKSSIADKQAAVVIKAEPTTSPMTITNVKDGDLTNTSTDAINGGQLVKATGAKFIDDPSSTTDPKAKKMVFADGKDGLSGLEKTSDGKESMANKGLTAKDGLNGKNANDKANALRNGEAGTVVFTDKDGNRLVKANDGKYYKATDVDDKGNVKSAANGQVAPKVVDNPQLSLVNTGGEINKAVVLSNVASGLGLTTPTDDKKETLNKLADTVKEKVKALGEKTKELSDKATKLADLELMVDSLKQTVDTLPDGEAKDKIREELKNYEPQLSAAKEAKENAKKAVKSARDALIAANKDYKKQYNDYSKATEKVADLVKPDSKANPTNVATVGDLQAVARAGLNFEGNDGIAVHQDVGETLTLKGEGEFNSDNSAAGNIKVEMAKDGRGLEVKLSDKLKNMTSFETREVDGKTSRLDSNGLRVVDKDSEAVVTAQGTRIAGKGNHAGKSASYTLDGIALKDKNGKDAVSLNAKALSFAVTQDQAGAPVGTGVIRGLKDLDAHATGDMAANKNYVDAKHHELRHALNHSNKELRAGIAGANAASALASVSMPGKSMVAVAAAGYDGENAVAIGYSRVSDSGKVMLKLQGNSNSQGKVAGAVSVGYQW